MHEIAECCLIHEMIKRLIGVVIAFLLRFLVLTVALMILAVIVLAVAAVFINDGNNTVRVVLLTINY